MTTPLTTHLLSLHTPTPYTAATQHEFLKTASTGTLPDTRLSLYLAQDRLYAAHGYPRFIGHLLASIPFSSLHPPISPPELFNRRILELLTYALTNVVRETAFFGSTAEKYELGIERWREMKATRDYVAEMGSIGSSGNLKDGLVFLWAMERVYLDSWKYVAANAAQHTSGPSAAPLSPALIALIDNWTNPEFEKFVKDLEDLVNDLDIQPGTPAGDRAEAIWARVVELEAAFWPGTEDEVGILQSS